MSKDIVPASLIDRLAESSEPETDTTSEQSTFSASTKDRREQERSPRRLRPGEMVYGYNAGEGMDLETFKNSVCRDLQRLLNTRVIDYDRSIDQDHVRSSVLCYGLKDPTGRVMDDKFWIELEKDIRDAIERFEPRVCPLSGSSKLHVVCKRELVEDVQKLKIVIRGGVLVSDPPDLVRFDVTPEALTNKFKVEWTPDS